MKGPLKGLSEVTVIHLLIGMLVGTGVWVPSHGKRALLFCGDKEDSNTSQLILHNGQRELKEKLSPSGSAKLVGKLGED